MKSQYAEMKKKNLHGEGKTVSRRDLLRDCGWAWLLPSTKQVFHTGKHTQVGRFA